MRIRKLEAEWREFFLKPPAEQCLLEGAVLLAQMENTHKKKCHKKNISTLLTDVTKSIDKVVKKVTKLLISDSSLASPKRTISFINQVLQEKIGVKGTAKKYLSVQDFFIDQVGTWYSAAILH